MNNGKRRRAKRDRLKQIRGLFCYGRMKADWLVKLDRGRRGFRGRTYAQMSQREWLEGGFSLWRETGLVRL